MTLHKESTMTIEDGRDELNLRKVQWTIDIMRMPSVVRELVTAAEVAHSRADDWRKFVENYPEQIANDRVKYATIIGAAIPATATWFVGWLMVCAGGVFVGWGWMFVLWLLSSAMVGAGIMFANAFRFRRYVKPLDLAYQESMGHMLFYQIHLFFFPVVFIWAGWKALDAFVALPSPKPEGEMEESLRVCRDTRAKVAMAMAAGIRTLNLLAYALKHELDLQRMNGAPGPGETSLDIDRTRALLRGIRETVMRQQEFLQHTYDDAALGDFRSDVTALVIANSDKISQASGILAESREQGATVIELAAALAGQKGAMMRRQKP